MNTSEHDKLRARIKNIGRNVTEYRMTVAEAKALLVEFDNKEKHVESHVDEEALEVYYKTMDGGTF